MKKIFVIVILCFCIKLGHAQAKKEIHFLADTINVSPENRLLDIDTELKCKAYMFFCQCLPPYGYGYKISFAYLDLGESALNPHVNVKPNYAYMTWKSLSDIIGKEKYDFDKHYELYITEVLPNNKYKTNKVKLVVYREPIQDIIRIKDKQ